MTRTEDARMAELAATFGLVPQGPGDLDDLAERICAASGLDGADAGDVGEAIGGTFGAVRAVLSGVVVHDDLWAWAAGDDPPPAETLERLLRTVAVNTPETPAETVVQRVMATLRSRLAPG